jgi:hypothetical protein
VGGAAIAGVGAEPAQAAADQTGRLVGSLGPAGFRETLWFKKGEVEERLAAEEGADGLPDLEIANLEERYRDDGTLTAEERRRLSLKTGHTQVMRAPRPKPDKVVSGERMSDSEMLSAIDSSRTRNVVIAILILAAGIAVLLYLFVFRSPSSPKTSDGHRPVISPSSDPTPRP